MARASLVCPACGSRNKAEWEFCARCGESLEAALDEASEAQTSLAEEEATWPTPDSGTPSSVIVGIGIVSFGALGLMTCRNIQNAPPTPSPEPGIFYMGTQPTAPPRQSGPAKAGFDAFAEGRRRLAAGNAAEALELLAQAVQADPSNPEYLSVYGQALLKTGSKEQGVAQLAEAARIAPQYALEYARALNVIGRNADAVGAYERMLATEPGNATVQEDLGRLLYRMGDFAKAAPLLDGAVKARPTDPALGQELAYALDRAGRAAEAAQAYRQVLAIAPDADTARGLLADSLQRQGKTEDAIALVNDGIKRDPEASLLHRALGSLYEQSGRPQDAAREYGEYVRLAPGAADVQLIKERASKLVPSGQ